MQACVYYWIRILSRISVKKIRNIHLTAVLLFFTGIIGCNPSTVDVKPNIVYILADDLGYGDLSCYGQKNFNTPNIDRMAQEGICFTNHYSGSTVCAPSRSVLMTGQHSGHAPIRDNKEVGKEGQYPLEDGAFTIAEMLKQAGYATGAFATGIIQSICGTTITKLNFPATTGLKRQVMLRILFMKKRLNLLRTTGIIPFSCFTQQPFPMLN